ncbi:LPS export ABC transporter permease LptF [Wenzhouxiangella sp. XN79A]|uniref:LPS export ABC transporter permease LptF n=1 Tax=Wenzhouxiangella sp. XN79A TaxID=2724193 RepID=UPI00144A7CE4|nr:LPS export ABC transporter permease LptF [Wenzhouxiangella sp. XN79A]NKI35054.1 LPS export ABC transporter permease LptF [Wenzhouxiangella sp. XN79A]
MNGAVLTRYLVRQTAGAALATLLVLLGVTLALFLAELLGEVADGRAASRSVFLLLALRVPEAVHLVAPLALMLGVLMTLGQLASGGELSVMRAAGLAPLRLALPLLGLAVLWSAAVLAVSGWIAPWTARESAALDARLAEDILLSGLRPGQFQRLGGGALNVFVGEIDSETATLRDVFIQRSDDERTEILRAPRGALSVDPERGLRLLTLFDGVHISHADDGAGLPLRVVRFARNEFDVPVPVDPDATDPVRSRESAALLRGGSIEERRELHWRAAPALAGLLLTLLVLPAALASPRGGRFGVIVPALVVYLVYTNGLNLVLGRDDLDPAGAWVVHGLVALPAVLALIAWQRRW